MKNEVIPPLEKRLEMVLRYSRVLLERIPRVGMWVFTNRRADERLFCDPQGRPRSLQSRVSFLFFYCCGLFVTCVEDNRIAGS